MYLGDNDDRYPCAWTSLVKTEAPVGGYQRYCRWHDPRYPGGRSHLEVYAGIGRQPVPGFRHSGQDDG